MKTFQDFFHSEPASIVEIFGIGEPKTTHDALDKHNFSAIHDHPLNVAKQGIGHFRKHGTIDGKPVTHYISVNHGAKNWERTTHAGIVPGARHPASSKPISSTEGGGVKSLVKHLKSLK